MEYRPEIIAQLARHGLRPRAGTRPEFLQSALGDLYRYQIRMLRECLLQGKFPRREYAGRVSALRDRYWLLSYPLKNWLMPELAVRAFTTDTLKPEAG